MFCRNCPACKAKDQTIVLLADLVDWHRNQMSVASIPAAPTPEALRAVEPQWAAPGALWASDEEEDIVAALESGDMDSAAAERALAFIQAQNTTLEVVK